jgi:membrane-bound ClpP family serine protease
MKTLSIIFYIIGSILLIVSCFTTSISVTWWLGGIAVVFLIGGCVCQFNANSDTHVYHNHNSQR